MINLISAVAPAILSCSLAQEMIYKVSPDQLTRQQYTDIVQTIADHSYPGCLLFTVDGELLK